MAMVVDEEEIYKCSKHPTKRRRIGVCPRCLRDRLTDLCPECANVRPCPCSASTSSSSSSSDIPNSASDIGSVGRVSRLIESEPSFRRSRSLAFPFLRRNAVDKGTGGVLPPSGSKSRSSPWSVFNHQKSKRVKEEHEESGLSKMIRSKSVGFFYRRDQSDVSRRSKGWGWFFPSPMKIFRHPKTTKVVQEGSPQCRN